MKSALAVLSVPFGLLAGWVALVAGAAVSSSRVVGVLAGVAVLLLVTLSPRLLRNLPGKARTPAPNARALPGKLPEHGPDARALPGKFRDLAGARWLPVAASALTLALFAATAGVVVLVPPPGEVTAAPSGARFWDLPTGSRIAYVHTPARGTPRATPVILVHGGPGAPAQPNVLAEPLAANGFDVYEYHQFGAGWSSRAADPGQYTVARHVADLEAIRVAIGADRIVLSGVSWGGQLIAHYLAAHHRHVARAVVAVPAPIWSPSYPDDSQLTRGGLDDQQRALLDHPRFLAAQILLQAAGPRTAHVLVPDGQVDRAYQAFVADLNMRAGCASSQTAGSHIWQRPPFGFWANAMTALDMHRVADPRPALRSAATPVLVIRAGCDYLEPRVAQEYVEVLPHAESVTIPGAGHEIAGDSPGAYIQAVLAFVTA